MNCCQRISAVIVVLLPIIAYAIPGRATTETVLYSFSNQDGAAPSGALVLDNVGNLYGTTRAGGPAGQGTVFELAETSGVWTESVLYNFKGLPDGAEPLGGVIFDSAGNLYGTTSEGGPTQSGTVFELSPTSGGGWTEKIIYAFTGGADGCNPDAGLAMDSLGNLYGTTISCGEHETGTVFEVSPSEGGWVETTLWEFSGASSATASGLVLDAQGNLYGTTTSQGTFYEGSVFKVTQASGTWNLISIYSFTGGDNGCNPVGDLIFDKAGSLYGSAQQCGADDVGTIFKLTPSVGQWSLSVLHTFTGGADGAFPESGLTFDSQGNLYGTTYVGGLFGNGTVFRLRPRGGRWTEAEYGFMGGTDGSNPSGSVTIGKMDLFGATTFGGSNSDGTIYEVTAK